MRTIIAAVMAVAVGITITTVASPAEAAKKGKNKQCMATNAAGKKVSFKCAASEKCCWQPLIQKGACVPANGICL